VCNICVCMCLYCFRGFFLQCACMCLVCVSRVCFMFLWLPFDEINKLIKIVAGIGALRLIQPD